MPIKNSFFGWFLWLGDELLADCVQTTICHLTYVKNNVGVQFTELGSWAKQFEL